MLEGPLVVVEYSNDDSQCKHTTCWSCVVQGRQKIPSRGPIKCCSSSVLTMCELAQRLLQDRMCFEMHCHCMAPCFFDLFGVFTSQKSPDKSQKPGAMLSVIHAAATHQITACLDIAWQAAVLHRLNTGVLVLSVRREASLDGLTARLLELMAPHGVGP